MLLRSIPRLSLIGRYGLPFSFVHVVRRAVISAALLVFFGLAACSQKPKLSPLPAGTVVVAFGDSVTYGYGAGPGEDWPSKLAAMTGWRIVNGGVSGDTAQAGKGRIKALLDETKPAMVLVEIGGNDFLRRRKPKEVKEDIRDIIASIRKSGAEPVLVAVPEASLGALAIPTDADIYAELSKEEKVAIIPGVFSKTLGQAELRSDMIHPNAQGYAQMATGIFAEMKRIGLVPG